MANELLEALRELGVTVTVVGGGRMRLEPASKVPAELVPHIREAKPAIIAALSPPSPKATALRAKPGVSFWLEKRDSDPAGDAVRALLKPDEYIDGHGAIRRAS